MATLYPIQIDDTTTLPPVVDGVTPVSAATINIIRDAAVRIETVLGISPASIYGTVANRLAFLEQLIADSVEGSAFTAGGDLSGSQTSQLVIGLGGRPFSLNAPSADQIIAWNGTQWLPTTPPSTAPSGPAGGDLTGTFPDPTVVSIQGVVITGTPTTGQLLTATSPAAAHWASAPSGFIAATDLSGTPTSQTVVGLQNHPLASTAPVTKAVPIYNGTQYDVRQLTLDDLGAAFTITGFSGGSVVECGATVTNPAFAASYSVTPASAQITNTDAVDSPLTLTTPFTSGTVVGSFSKGGVNASTTFTLTAVGATTKTATQAITWEARSFGGVGPAGATSSVTASGTTAVLSNSAVLASTGLHTSDVNQTYGPFSPSNQKIYLLLVGSAHVIKDPSTNTIIPCNVSTAVSFVNQNSATISMSLYETTNLLTGSFSTLVSA